MGIHPAEILSLTSAPNRESATKILEALRERFRQGFARLALELHPDHTQNDPEKTADFRVLLDLKKDFYAIKVPENYPKRYSTTFHLSVSDPRPAPHKVVTRYYPKKDCCNRSDETDFLRVTTLKPK